MRKIRYILPIALFALMLCSCRNGNIDSDFNSGLILDFSTNENFDISAQATKGSLTEKTENRINDLRIFVVRSGNVVLDITLGGDEKVENVSASSTSCWQQSAISSNSGLIKIVYPDQFGDDPISIYGLANTKNSKLALPETVQTVSDLDSIVLSLASESIERSAMLPMAAKCVDVDPVKNAKLYFNRIDAKISVTVTADNGYTVVPKTWIVKGASKSCHPFGAEMSSATFDSNEQYFENDNEFSFYALPSANKVSIQFTAALSKADSVIKNATIDYSFEIQPSSNVYYICTAKFNGVNSIETKVETGIETNPDYNGRVIEGSKDGTVFIADAHYETKVVSIDKSDLDSTRKAVFSTTDKTEWVKFVFNDFDEETSSYSTAAKNYPGDGSKALIFPSDLYSAISNAQADSSGKVFMTMFVDEYYDENDWKSCVNSGTRVMTVLCSSVSSTDHKSSKSNSLITIIQRSILTVSNPELVSTAFGVESVNESGELPYNANQSKGSYKGNSYANNGRFNSFRLWDLTPAAGGSFFSNKKWETYKTSQKSYAEYACMSRNRDNNGDGIIDAKELKWFTPAIEQLNLLWIGCEALDAAARLDGNVISSTSSSSDYDDPKIIWAGKGFVPGTLSDLISASAKYEVRCIRNLGVQEGGNDDPMLNLIPESPVIYSNSSFDFSKISPLSLRNYSETDIDENYEYGYSNRVWKNISIADSKLSFDEASISEINTEVSNSGKNKYCPEGYRLPNQKELLMMSYYCPDVLKGTVSSCRTLYSTKLEGEAYSWIYDGNFKPSSGSMKTTSIRCVKDSK